MSDEARDWRATGQEIVDQVYGLLGCVTRALDAAGVEYAIAAGTLLGAVRHGGLIPWDDDADLYVLASQQDRLNAARPELDRAGVTLHPWFFGFKACGYLGAPWGEAAERMTYPTVDMFVLDDRVADAMPLACPRAHALWPNEHVYADEWRSRVPTRFGNAHFSGFGASESEGYLARMYGPNWRVETFEVWDHLNDVPAERVPLPLPTTRCALPRAGCYLHPLRA
ncbi:LicD family protein [Burkholderia stagnalis]|uniref:LicD family protein n=1 Tax=Burkholderia stagnalis TaxID=1503054 RepID=UPI000F80813B|nr:LicD family protein [Burkholderia stagnalis]